MPNIVMLSVVIWTAFRTSQAVGGQTSVRRTKPGPNFQLWKKLRYILLKSKNTTQVFDIIAVPSFSLAAEPEDLIKLFGEILMSFGHRHLRKIG